MKGAIVGLGFISGKGHLPAYLERQDVEIVAIADICAERRELARRTLPHAQIFSSAGELFQAFQNKSLALDFVDISTPPSEHAALSIQALELGLHVLCEKPLTTTLADAEKLLMTAKKNKRVLFPCHNYKHAPVVKAIQEVIDSGKIGKIRSLHMTTSRNTHAKGVTEWHTHWRREKKYSGGGIAMDHGSHTFYLTFDWLKSYPVAVTAQMLNLDSEKYDTEDNFNCVLSFPESKFAQASLSWTAGIRKVVYAVQGDKGAVTVTDDDLELATIEKTDGPDVAQGAVKWNIEKKSIASHWMDASHVSWFNSLFDQFRAAIQAGEYVGKEAQEAYRCIQIITEAYLSAENHCQERHLAGLPDSLA